MMYVKKAVMALVMSGLVLSVAAAQDANKGANEYINDLASEDEVTVITAIDWLGEKEEKNALSKLTEMMQQDKRIAVRAHAASSLGLLAQKESMQPLIDQMVKESSPVVRYSMVLAMARIGIESKEQYDALMQIKQSESDPYIKDFIEKMEEKFKK